MIILHYWLKNRETSRSRSGRCQWLGGGVKRKDGFVEYDVPGDVNPTRRWIEALVPLM
jgi:hypothetical protein